MIKNMYLLKLFIRLFDLLYISQLYKFNSTNLTLVHTHIHPSCTHSHIQTFTHAHSYTRTPLAALFLASWRRRQPRRIHKKLPHRKTNTAKTEDSQWKMWKRRRKVPKEKRRKRTITGRKSGMKMNRARKTEFAHAKGFHTSLWPNQSNLCASPTFQVCCIWEELCGCPTLDGACGHIQCKDNDRAKEICSKGRNDREWKNARSQLKSEKQICANGKAKN